MHATSPADDYAGLVPLDVLEDRDEEATGNQVRNPNLMNQSDLFTRHTAAELANADLTLTWLVRGILSSGTYGQLAGALKTLKTWVALLLAISVASGRPLFGRFGVEQPGPVLIYVGEGGRIPFTRRLMRALDALGIDIRSIPLHVVFDVAPIGSDRFRESLARDLAEVKPVLFILDPYYAYHGTAIDARQLHQEGALLSSLSSVCMAAGTSLLVVNHYNQTGTGRGLERITQAGSGEWVDSWLLLSHRERADVDNGEFRLLLEVGSRQWGGTTWDLDLTIGRLDPETGLHDGAIEWDIRPHVEETEEDRAAHVRHGILATLEEEPWTYTKTELAAAVGGNRAYARGAIKQLATDGAVVTERLPHPENGRIVTRTLYGLPNQPVPRPEQAELVGGAS